MPMATEEAVMVSMRMPSRLLTEIDEFVKESNVAGGMMRTTRQAVLLRCLEIGLRELRRKR